MRCGGEGWGESESEGQFEGVFVLPHYEYTNMYCITAHEARACVRSTDATTAGSMVLCYHYYYYYY